MKKMNSKFWDEIRKRIRFLVSLYDEGTLSSTQKTELAFCNGIEMIYMTGYSLSDDIAKAIELHEKANVLYNLGTSLDNQIPDLIEEAWKIVEPHVENARMALIE